MKINVIITLVAMVIMALTTVHAVSMKDVVSMPRAYDVIVYSYTDYCHPVREYADVVS